MRRLRAALQAPVWELLLWLACRRSREPRPDDVRRHLYRQQARGMGLRMTDALRDRLRGRWLRVTRFEDDA